MAHRLLPKPDAGPDDSIPDDALELKWEFDEDLCSFWGSLLLFWFRSRTLIVSG